MKNYFKVIFEEREQGKNGVGLHQTFYGDSNGFFSQIPQNPGVNLA